MATNLYTKKISKPLPTCEEAAAHITTFDGFSRVLI